VLIEPATHYGPRTLPPGGGQLQFRSVTAGPPGAAPVLQRIDLTIPAGGFVAVVGHSGAGKSLLAALAGRLCDPDSGEVLLDEVPLTELRHDELRGAIAYGFERPVLIGDTIGDAIAFGARRAEPQAVADAAVAARAHAFIERMSAGYDTRLGDAPMSGGELQRVALARAFAHNGRVLILDDVAASLDTVTEHQISAVLTGAFADRTRLVIAHRASTAARADVVIWLDGARVRAVAPHRELWRDADYRLLFNAQPESTTVANDEVGVAS
jgi:ATP-binding cassette subfamily B protein